MNWLGIVIAGHLVNAFAFMVTKFLLDKHIKNAAVLAIFVGVLGMVVFAVAPWGLLQSVNFSELMVNLAAGALLIFALLLFNYVLKNYDVSQVVPISGGSVPLFTFILAYFFLNERLGLMEILSLVALVVGTLILSFDKKKKSKFSWSLMLMALASGLLFAASFVITKYAFDTQDFISSFIWIRLGSFLVALCLLMNPKYAQKTWEILQKTSLKIKVAVIASLGLSALGFVMLSFGIDSGSVTLVNALQGVQYAFLLLLVIIASKFFPKFIKENLSKKVLMQKIFGIVCVSLGIVFLAI